MGRYRNHDAADRTEEHSADGFTGRLRLIRAALALIGGAKAIAFLIPAMIALTQVAFAVPLATTPVWTFGTAKVPDLPCMTPQEKNTLQGILDRINRWEPQINALIAKAAKAADREQQNKLLSEANLIFRKQLFFIDEYNNLISKIFERRCPKAAAVPPLNFPLIFPLPGGLGLISMLGPHLGLETVETVACLTTTERSAATDEVTNRFKDCKDPLGIGIVAGYNFAPWNNNIVVGPFASFDYAPLSINHTFPTGNYLGSRSHWVTTAGIKAGIVTTPGIFFYGLTGAALLNQDLNINFGGPIASSNTTVPGYTLGLGAEYQPNSWQVFGRPLSLFVQYQHTWWQDAHLDRPAASPLFNYAFRREDDTVKFGVNIYFGSPTPVEQPRPMIVKAPRLK
jgi:opacity protein-like surface antigen